MRTRFPNLIQLLRRGVCRFAPALIAVGLAACAPALTTVLIYGPDQKAQEIIRSGKYPNYPKKKGLVYLAADYGRSPETIRLLIERGAPVNEKEYGNYDFRTALHVAGGEDCWSYGCADRPDVAAVLIENGGDVNAEASSGLTPLSFYCLRPKTEAVFLAHGADVNRHARPHPEPGGCKECEGNTPLHVCADKDAPLTTLELLLSHGADPNATNAVGRSPLFAAKSSSTVAYLLDHRADARLADSQGQTPLHLTNDVRVAQLLLDHGAEVDARDKSGSTPLSGAIRRGVDVRPMVEFLLAHGADPGKKKTGSPTPLAEAVKDGNLDLVKRLLELGADPNIPDSSGATALFAAIPASYRPRFDDERLQLLHVLLAAHANPDILGPGGQGLVHLLAGPASPDGSTNALEVLLDAGATADLQNAQGRTALSVVRPICDHLCNPGVVGGDQIAADKALVLLAHGANAAFLAPFDLEVLGGQDLWKKLPGLPGTAAFIADMKRRIVVYDAQRQAAEADRQARANTYMAPSPTSSGGSTSSGNGNSSYRPSDSNQGHATMHCTTQIDGAGHSSEHCGVW